MKVSCRTNLDLTPAEKWPDELPTSPHVGDYIESGYEWTYYDTPMYDSDLRQKVLEGKIQSDYRAGPYKSRLELAVVGIHWRVFRNTEDELDRSINRRYAELELHLPPSRFSNLTDFYEWYGKITMRGKSAFI